MLLGNFLEVVIPTITAFFICHSNLKPVAVKQQIDDEAKDKLDKLKSPVEERFFLKRYEGTFHDFLEIVTQFGFVSLSPLFH